MKFPPSVVHVEHRGDHRLYIVFSDGSANTIDFARWLDGPVFEPLRSVEFFKRVFIDGGTVAWPNGADIAPETLYEVPGRRNRPKRRFQPSKARRPTARARRTPERLRG